VTVFYKGTSKHLPQIFVSPYFSTVTCVENDVFRSSLPSKDIVHGKPNPEIYLKAAERFGIEPSSLMVFETGVQGSLAAHTAGAFTVVVLASHNKMRKFPHASLIVRQLNAAEALACFDEEVSQ
jgi:beta-phosphoglucomutase-like phosphatase (HAD superfamily)